MSEAENTAGKQRNSHLKKFEFKPGQSGNPKGRPKSSRNKLGEQFLEAMQKDFAEFGAEAICLVREERTDVYIKVIASLLPKEMNLIIDPFDKYTNEQLNDIIERRVARSGSGDTGIGAEASQPKPDSVRRVH